VPCFGEFDIDLVSALREQLFHAFGKLEQGPLSDDQINMLRPGQGVYLLYQQSNLVYIGKASKLANRLRQHRRKISGRRNIQIDEMSFKCLFLSNNWVALAPEASLIRHFEQSGFPADWNGSGFGSKDPGNNREETKKPPDGFDVKYPIRDDWQCDGINPGTWNCLDLLLSLKDNLPYLLRFQFKYSYYRKGHPGYNEATVEVPVKEMPARDLLRLIVSCLDGWQATVFPGHMILYQESRDYKYGEVLKPL
jgi:hypothetical protein